MTTILGISAFYHDSAACLVRDGDIVAAAQEERFTRKKHDHQFPTHAIEYCLQEAGIRGADLDYVGFYDKPFKKFERILETYLSYAPQGLRSFWVAMPLWLREKLHLPRLIDQGLGNEYRGPLIFTHHHESHAASAFFPSPFERAAILTVDGVGEWATTTFGVGEGNRVRLLKEIHFPHSLGLLYTAFTSYCGFRVNSGEYKLMGLAPYGKPKYVDLIKDRLIRIKPDGSFRLNMDYFNYCQGLTMTNRRFHELFGVEPRRESQPITEGYMDIAASIQEVTGELMLKMARHVAEVTGEEDFCMAGGCALNCVANGRILRDGIFKRIFIQPASGDAGGALGVALHIWYHYLGNERRPPESDAQKGSLLGPAFSSDEIRGYLDSVGAKYTRIESESELCSRVADLLDQGMAVGWFQGRLEFGPRALGSRSILGDPRNHDMQRNVNLKIKFRESFRPFAPSVLAERSCDYFDLPVESPYMLLVGPVQPARRVPLDAESDGLTGLAQLRVRRSEIPAVTHVDYSARIQTVDPMRNPRYHRLLKEFEARTGCPVILNTSFNVRGEPIVCSPQEAYRCFMATNMDVLVLEDCLLLKQDQQSREGAEQYRPAFQAD